MSTQYIFLNIPFVLICMSFFLRFGPTASFLKIGNSKMEDNSFFFF